MGLFVRYRKIDMRGDLPLNSPLMQLDTDFIEQQVLETPFDPMLCSRLQSATQLKRRLKVGMVFGNMNQRELSAYKFITEAELERFSGKDWPQILSGEGYTDLSVLQPLGEVERIPHALFRIMRKKYGEVFLTPGFLREVIELGRKGMVGLPIAPSRRTEFLEDSYGPFLRAPIAESVRSMGLLGQMAVHRDHVDPTLLPVAQAMSKVHQDLKEKLGLAELLQEEQ